MQRTIFNEEHDAFRSAFRSFLEDVVVPNHDQWEKDKIVPRDVWIEAGKHGFLCTDVPEQYGGGGIADFRYHTIKGEEVSRVGATGIGFGLHDDVVVPYLLKYANDEQKERFLPKMVSGECITAIAMTEPGTGSDLAAVRTTAIDQGDHYLLNGTKTFITNGINSDLVIVVAKTDPSEKHKGMSLLFVERGMEGFSRGRNLEKIGMHAQDTAELIFEDVRVPKENLLGDEGMGFLYLMEALPQERLSIAVGAMAGSERAVDMTMEYCRSREAFGRPIGQFQNTRFELASMKTANTVARSFVDQCIMTHNDGGLSVEDAAMAKYWTTDLLNDTVTRCVQLHGGYGFMREYPIARAFCDSRVMAIYGGTNEIMKEIIGKSMGF